MITRKNHLGTALLPCGTTNLSSSYFSVQKAMTAIGSLSMVTCWNEHEIEQGKKRMYIYIAFTGLLHSRTSSTWDRGASRRSQWWLTVTDVSVLCWTLAWNT